MQGRGFYNCGTKSVKYTEWKNTEVNFNCKDKQFSENWMTEKTKSEKKETNTHQEKQIIADERTQSTSDQSSNDKQNVF